MPKDQKFSLKGHLCLHQSFPQLVAIVVLANILMYSSKDGASNLGQKSDEKFSKEAVKNNSEESMDCTKSFEMICFHFL